MNTIDIVRALVLESDCAGLPDGFRCGRVRCAACDARGWLEQNPADPRDAELARLKDELKKWQAGGVTEELLRAHDGCIRIGRGCDIAIVSAEDWDRLHADLADARATFDDLAGPSPSRSESDPSRAHAGLSLSTIPA